MQFYFNIFVKISLMFIDANIDSLRDQMELKTEQDILILKEYFNEKIKRTYRKSHISIMKFNFLEH